ncbi:MAG: divergent polysaccharide deacetylase family protein, partial [Kiloniellaceae bacterium]
RSHLAPIMEEIKARGLLYLDNRATQQGVAGALATELGVPYAINNRFLDLAQASRVAVDDRLRQLERVARDTGAAVAMGQLYPVTIERVREWARDVESRGFVLTPISALAASTLAARDEARAE